MSKKRKSKYSINQKTTKKHANGSHASSRGELVPTQAKNHHGSDGLISSLTYQISLLDKKSLRLENKNALLSVENNNLKEQLNYYKKAYQEADREKKVLAVKELKAQDKVQSYANSMSFRLGYAIIFAFKEKGGVKRLLKTIATLIHEKRNKKIRQKLVFNHAAEAAAPQMSLLQWNQRKPTFQWLDNKLVGKELLSSSQAEALSLDRKGMDFAIPVHGISQVLLSIDVSSESPAPKQVLVSFTFEDKEKKALDSGIDYPFSQSLNRYYAYLNTETSKIDQILLALPHDCETVNINVQTWDNKKAAVKLNAPIGIEKLSAGVSVVIPTYQGVQTIGKCIKSLLHQTLSPTLYELLVVINGPQDGTQKLLEKIKRKNPEVNIRVFILEEAGVGKARNLAIQEAQYNYITFIDDDDFVSEDYLASLYAQANYHSLVLTGVDDVTTHGETIPTAITQQLEKAEDKAVIQYNDVSSSLTMNACKLAPAHMVKATAYLPELRSGEDVVYWSDLISRFQPNIALVHDLSKAVYKRVLSDNSVSRQKESFDFNVKQRLDVILYLIALLEKASVSYTANFIQSKINAQAGFIKRYLDKHPQEYPAFQQLIEQNKVDNVFIRDINAKFSKALIISYCYAPYIDTSGVVMSKRVREMNQPVDIIYNSMNKVRSQDKNLLKISAPFVGQMIELKASQTFSNWKGIQQFAEQAFIEMGKILSRRPLYEKIYSRAMWPASHFAAALIKAKYPQIKWVAEFSDPLLLDVTGSIRYETLELEWLRMHHLLPENSTQTNDNLFYWCEMLPYLYADELIFTNQNQLDYMLSYADEEMREAIARKAVIMPQPTLPRDFYQQSSAQLKKEKDYFYIGYFGSFYPNRGFQPFLDAWEMLPDEIQAKLRLIVYTQQQPEAVLENVSENIKDKFIIYPYVEYFDFLKLCDDFDALLVMDAITQGLKINNPYLPSKLSDYLGSQTPTLALVEENSPMSHIHSSKLIKADIHSKEKIKQAILSHLF